MTLGIQQITYGREHSKVPSPGVKKSFRIILGTCTASSFMHVIGDGLIRLCSRQRLENDVK